MQLIITALEQLRMVAYFNFIGSTMFIYDYFLTLPSEVNLVWPAPWNLMKVLFIVTRYLPFADVVVHLYYHLQSRPTAAACLNTFIISSWLFYAGTATSELILTLRTWAVWNRDWRLSIGLPIFFALYLGVNIPFILKFLKSLKFMALPTPAMLGCVAIKGSHIVSICWTLLLVYEGGIFFLMLIKGIRTYKNGGDSDLFRVVYRDGVLYYLYLFAFSIANVIVVATVPPGLQVVLIMCERVLHPILACRVLLDIRAQVTKNSDSAFLTAPPQPPIVINKQSSSTIDGYT